MKIYRLGSQLVPMEELAYAAVETGGECEMTMVVDEEGSLPPADARLVDVDEARAALEAGLAHLNIDPEVWRISGGGWSGATEEVAKLVARLFPEGE